MTVSMMATPRARTAVCDDLSALAQIYEADVNVCVVRRVLPFALDGPDARPEHSARFFMSASDDLPVSNACLASDLSFLAELLSDLTGANDIGVRISRGNAPMCPRLHVDHVPLRLVCTYVGPGTEWIDQGRGASWFDCGATSRAGALRSAHPGDIVLLKGEGWPGNEGRGAAHRSPAHDGLRLLASLDPV